MSDLNMLPCHLPDTYIDVVKAHHTQQGNHEQQSPWAKALSGWLFPSSMFEPDHQVSCDQGSVDTEGTLEEDWDDDVDDNWDDTYSIESEDVDDSSSSEDNGDGLFGLPTLLDETNDDDEGHFYFDPKPEDFPRGPIQRQKELEDLVVPAEQVDEKESSQTHDALVAFGEGLMQGIDKIRLFADKAIKDACKAGEEVLQESEVLVNKTRDNLVQFFEAPSRDLAQNTTVQTSRRNLANSSYSRKSTSSERRNKTSSKDRMKSKGRRSKAANCQDDLTKKSIKPGHRRTMSRRLHPSAFDQNDFPWY